MIKKYCTLFLVVVMLFSFAACGGNSALNKPEQTITASVDLHINNSSEDPDFDTKVFDFCDNRFQDFSTMNAYIHYKVTDSQDSVPIRLLIESQWGSDEYTKEDFTVESDEMLEVPTDEWQYKSFSITASNLYFYRATIYYGETDTVLASKMIYTPYEKNVYGNDFAMSQPTFHHYELLNDKEQRLYDLTSKAIIDYALTNHYLSVQSYKGWESNSDIYVSVDYKANKGYKDVVLAINKNTGEYVSGSWDLIPDSVGTADNWILDDDYYIVKALSKELL